MDVRLYNHYYVLKQSFRHKEAVLESLFRTHDYLLRNLGEVVRRSLYDAIDFARPLIGILGTRGVGKTTFLLSYAQNEFGVHNRSCLYVNLNRFFFTEISLVDFAGQFVEQGGEVLLLDQVFKYPNWRSDLVECITRYPSLRVIYAGSVMQADSFDPESMSNVGDVYHLSGFSFREFINHQCNLSIPPISLSDLLTGHADYCRTVLSLVNPYNLFSDYLHHGYYPFFLEQRNYSENLLKHINMMLEVDLVYVRNIDQRLLPKLRKMLHLISQSAPSPLNISQLAQSIETSRSTVSNYLHYLSDADLIKTLYKADADQSKKKPSRCYLHNTNIAHLLSSGDIPVSDLLSTFLLNQLEASGQVCCGNGRNEEFVLSSGETICLVESLNVKPSKDKYDAVYRMTIGDDRQIPIWAFGFTY